MSVAKSRFANILGRQLPARATQMAFSVSCVCLSVFLPAQAREASTGETREPEEIIVTAQKYEERLQEVPVPVTAIDADVLANTNQLRLQDYYTRVPGLNLVKGAGARGETNLAIRGITTGVANPTVGVTVDDVPYGSSVNWGAGYAAPDFDPGDLDRVEVLRGPQGTLYGANSIGGLVKYVTVDPSTDEFRGSLEGGINSVHGGDDQGYNVRASLNIPLGETFAIRASGFTRRDPGYIDNPSIGATDVNEADVDSGQLAAMWRPSDAFSLKLSGLVQKSSINGPSYVNLGTGIGDLQQVAARNTGWFDRKFQVYSAVARAELGSVELTSVSGYSINNVDGSIQFGGIGAILEDLETEKVSQELRFAGSLGERVDWLLGGFFDREQTDSQQDLQSLNPATGAPTGSLLYASFPTDFDEYAAFANLTYKFSDRFDVQVGGRYSENKQTYSRVAVGAFAPIFYGQPSPVITTEREARDDPFTYLVTPRFKISQDTMVYARFASGYRPGSLNSGVIGVPFTYDADTTANYELGTKGSIKDSLLTYDLSVYYIDWKDIQVTVLPVSGAQIAYISNVGRARSQGVELSLELRPTDGLKIATWAAWNDAELTEDFPPTATVAGGNGERLPFSAQWTGNLSIDQEFALTSTVTAFVGASASYVGEREGSFFPRGVRRQEYPSYTQIDARAGVEVGSWRADLYVNNASDERGSLNGDPSAVPTTIFYIQPRTVGLSLTKSF